MRVGINHYCVIKNGRVIIDGNEIHSDQKSDNFLGFIKGLYKQFDLNYPKFYKMDPLCKLAIVAVSILTEKSGMELNENTALVLSNKSSCIDADRKHLASIAEEENYYPSPGNFVYTLPNIALGEISIKYNLRSENTFFIFEDFNPTFVVNYTRTLFELNKASEVLCGWIEVNHNDYKAILYKVEGAGKIKHSAEEVLKFDSL